jgi:DNA-binding CsgD family transcriptional regulator
MVTLSEPSYQPRSDARQASDRRTRVAVGAMGDDLTVRRIETVLGAGYLMSTHGPTVDALLDGERCPIEVAVLAGGSELLAHGGPVERLQAVRPACAIVVVAMSEEVGVIRKALRGGVNGFVFHSALERALAPTAAAVRAGHVAVPRELRRRTCWSAFSVRERQVLQLAAEGLTNSEIADRLFLSESTVKCHLSSGFRKLGVCSRAEAAAAVLDPRTGLTAGTTPRAPGLAGHASAA